jgi:hypothetical protein
LSSPPAPTFSTVSPFLDTRPEEPGATTPTARSEPIPAAVNSRAGRYLNRAASAPARQVTNQDLYRLSRLRDVGDVAQLVLQFGESRGATLFKIAQSDPRLFSLAGPDRTAASRPRNSCVRSKPAYSRRHSGERQRPTLHAMRHERAYVKLRRARAAGDLADCGTSADSLERNLDPLEVAIWTDHNACPRSTSRNLCSLTFPIHTALPHLLGYARVSTADQPPELQLDALKDAGCCRTFADTASGALDERSGLAKVLTSCDRATPSSSGSAAASSIGEPSRVSRRWRAWSMSACKRSFSSTDSVARCAT